MPYFYTSCLLAKQSKGTEKRKLARFEELKSTQPFCFELISLKCAISNF